MSLYKQTQFEFPSEAVDIFSFVFLLFDLYKQTQFPPGTRLFYNNAILPNKANLFLQQSYPHLLFCIFAFYFKRQTNPITCFPLYFFVLNIYIVSMSRNESETEKSGISGLIQVLCQVREPEKMESLLHEILTPAEFHDLAMRWELMQRLQEGHTQRQIALDLGVSLCKITRGAKILKQKEAVSKKYLTIKEKQ